MNTKMKNILLFKWMITPVIIQIIFWVGTILAIVTGFWSIFTVSAVKGLWLIIFGPIAMRVICEILIVLFEINDNLTEINYSIGMCDEKYECCKDECCECETVDKKPEIIDTPVAAKKTRAKKTTKKAG